MTLKVAESFFSPKPNFYPLTMQKNPGCSDKGAKMATQVVVRLIG